MLHLPPPPPPPPPPPSFYSPWLNVSLKSSVTEKLMQICVLKIEELKKKSWFVSRFRRRPVFIVSPSESNFKHWLPPTPQPPTSNLQPHPPPTPKPHPPSTTDTFLVQFPPQSCLCRLGKHRFATSILKCRKARLGRNVWLRLMKTRLGMLVNTKTSVLFILNILQNPSVRAPEPAQSRHTSALPLSSDHTPFYTEGATDVMGVGVGVDRGGVGVGFSAHSGHPAIILVYTRREPLT